MEKPAPHEYKTPEQYELRVKGYDAKTGAPITYDHQPRVEVVDAKAGKYAFKWIGFDGLEKTATFYRVDAVDVLVSASVVKLLPDQYQYTYEVKNLPSSGTWLKLVIIQNFAARIKPESGRALDFKATEWIKDYSDESWVDVRTAYGSRFSAGLMSKSIKAYSEGYWIDFADVAPQPQVGPGQSVTIQFTSSAPPGLVECRAGAESELGAEEDNLDEDLPSDITLHDTGEYLHGWTIGPVDKLKEGSAAERVRYLLDRLPKLQQLGWITNEAASRYQQQLNNGGFKAVLNSLDQDLKSEQITSEVAAVIQAMN